MDRDHKSGGLIAELNRRNVFRVAIGYVLAGWVLLQIADVLFPALTLPEWTIRFVAGLLILGFPLVVFLAWAFELTPEGLKREHEIRREESITHETTKKLNIALVVMLIIALGVLALDRYVWVDPPVGEETPEVSAAIGDKSIAVLPFVNMSDDPSNEYFSDGMSEELLNLLARIPELKVIGRTSSFQFKGQNKDLRVIGEQLGVAHILEGSVRKSGDTVRVTAQLIDTRDGAHLWSDSFDRTLDDIFKVQDEIASSVVETLKITLLGEPIFEREKPGNSEAYDHYLKGRYFYRQLGDERLEQARTQFLRALELDPKLALAYYGLGSVYATEILNGKLTTAEGLPLALDALTKARKLDPMLANSHYALGFIKMIFEWDFTRADRAFRRALEIEPNSAQVLSGLGLLASIRREHHAAIDLHRRSLDIDPLRTPSHHNLGFVAFQANRFKLAEDSFREVLELSHGSTRSHYYIGMSLLHQGRPDEAYKQVQQEPSDQYRLAGIAITSYALGLEAESDLALRELKEDFSDKAAFLIAEVHAHRMEVDQALTWLERAIDQHEGLVPWIRSSPFLDSLHSDPRFKLLLERIGFEN